MIKASLLFATVFAVWCTSHPVLAANPKGDCIVVLGDSITRGARPAKASLPAVLPEETFCAVLEKQLAEQGRSVTVINAGVPSNRTDQGIDRLKADVLSHKPDLVLIMYGTNDSCYDTGKTEPRLSLAEYEKNLNAMIASIRKAGARPILMTPPPLKDGWGFPRNAVYVKTGSNGPLSTYAEACRQIAARENIPLIDHFSIWSEKGNDFVKDLLPDGCHPNAAGHKILAETIIPVVMKELPPKTSAR